MSLQRGRSISMISILGLAALACRLGGTGYWQGDATFVDAVAVDGSRRTVGPGRLVGLMRP